MTEHSITGLIKLYALMKTTVEESNSEKSRGNDTDEKERRDHEKAIINMIKTKVLHLLITPNHS